jgi:hypothetical protein
MQTDGDRALAQMMRSQVELAGKSEDPTAIEFITSALGGYYRTGKPIGPDYIGLTEEQFIAMQALAYANI